ncbi:WXG100 family type VII secretion target [Bacillus manliponensis]|uniref:ESAT-6-like protein n=1 Tax=Bacillus manliponensis TaxID=574376 RepID=A0A073K0P8_9BACI|nr:WXG100 family type VII secretion target [Bacillus manliponensis]KEK20007.1 type VII secretion protein EsxA [Bacillus manliponensis]
MAGQIRMSPEELKDKARRYGDGSQKVRDVLQDLKRLQNDLRTQWEGQAFDGFDRQFTDLEPKVNNFAQLLEDIQTQLTKTADAVAAHDQELSKNFGLN